MTLFIVLALAVVVGLTIWGISHSGDHVVTYLYQCGIPQEE